MMAGYAAIKHRWPKLPKFQRFQKQLNSKHGRVILRLYHCNHDCIGLTSVGDRAWAPPSEAWAARLCGNSSHAPLRASWSWAQENWNQYNTGVAPRAFERSTRPGRYQARRMRVTLFWLPCAHGSFVHTMHHNHNISWHDRYVLCHARL